MKTFKKGDNVKVLLDPDDDRVYVAQVVKPETAGECVGVKVMPFRDDDGQQFDGWFANIPADRVFKGPEHDPYADPSASRFHRDPVAELKRLFRRASERKFNHGDAVVASQVVAEVGENLKKLALLKAKVKDMGADPEVVALGDLKEGDVFHYIGKPGTAYRVVSKWGDEVVETAPAEGGVIRRSHAGSRVLI